nr:cytochrome c biogenesis FC, mitochondrial [Tanacetum cinerariifolium]
MTTSLITLVLAAFLGMGRDRKKRESLSGRFFGRDKLVKNEAYPRPDCQLLALSISSKLPLDSYPAHLDSYTSDIHSQEALSFLEEPGKISHACFLSFSPSPASHQEDTLRYHVQVKTKAHS